MIVAALVTAATLAAERLLFGRALIPAALALGIGWPRAPGLLMATAIGGLLLLVVAVFAAVTGASVTMVPGWWRALPGLFAQAGIAEEILFRGYLYGHLRDGTFWRAAGLATLPFAAAHVILFVTMPLFYYMVHAALIHLVAIAISYLQYGEVHWMFESPNPGTYPITPPPGWGLPLAAIYGVWIGVVPAMYPLCRWLAGVKERRRGWWLEYV